jgi:hypothetical protein
MAIPLSIILTVSGLKSLFEDWKRHKSDDQENNRTVLTLKGGQFVPTAWKNLCVGDVVKVDIPFSYHKLF